MEKQKTYAVLLDYMLQPAFCVTDDKIDYVNSAARGLLLEPGTDVAALLATGKQEYADFREGCLYLKLALASGEWGASVTAMGASHIFVLEPECAGGELQALALAAMALRQPLSNAIISAERLSAAQDEQDFLFRLNRGLHQLHRIVNNMSDAAYFSSSAHPQLQDLDQMFREIFDSAQVLVAHTGRCLTYQGLSEPVIGLADREQLERAVFSILSNALKFTEEGGRIEASLTRHGQLLRLSIRDNGTGIPDDLLPSIFSRYLRQPVHEDSRHGIGLGLILVRTVALRHGGTVLIDKPGETGTRVTMTLQLRSGQGDRLSTPILIPSGQDQGLIELSESLPHQLYQN